MNKGLVLTLCIIVLGVLSLHIGFCNQERSRSCKGIVRQPAHPSIQSYVWMDYHHRDRPLQYWIRIEKNGEVWYVQYDNFNRVQRDSITYPKILESKSGELSSSEVHALFELINRKGFFQMNTNYGGESEGILSEDDILTVQCKIEDKTKTVHARPPAFVPGPLSDIAIAIKEKISNLREDGKSGAFIKAEALDDTRAGALEERFEFNSLSEKELADHICLNVAVENPGQFVHVVPWRRAGIESYISKYAFFFVSTPNGKFQVNIFLR